MRILTTANDTAARILMSYVKPFIIFAPCLLN